MKGRNWIKLNRINELGDNHVHIFKVVLENVDWLDNIYSFDFISEKQKRKASRFRFTKDRRMYILSRFVEKYICCKLMNWTMDQIVIGKNQYGKPNVANAPYLHYNISHSNEILVFAVCNGYSVGVDVEEYNYDIDHASLATSVFSKEEIDQLIGKKSKDVVFGFYNCWSKKESYIKAIGKGLQVPLDQFVTRIWDEKYENLIEVKWDMSECNRWKLFNFEIHDTYAAACTSSIEIQDYSYFDITSMIIREMFNTKI